VVGRLEAFAAHRGEHLADLIRARDRLGDEVLAREIHLAALGPRADDRVVGRDEHATSAQRRRGHVVDEQLAAAEVLDDLLHVCSACR
jgi:hypothetical protein